MADKGKRKVDGISEEHPSTAVASSYKSDDWTKKAYASPEDAIIDAPLEGHMRRADLETESDLHIRSADLVSNWLQDSPDEEILAESSIAGLRKLSLASDSSEEERIHHMKGPRVVEEVVDSAPAELSTVSMVAAEGSGSSARPAGLRVTRMMGLSDEELYRLDLNSPTVAKSASMDAAPLPRQNVDPIRAPRKSKSFAEELAARAFGFETSIQTSTSSPSLLDWEVRAHPSAADGGLSARMQGNDTLDTGERATYVGTGEPDSSVLSEEGSRTLARVLEEQRACAPGGLAAATHLELAEDIAHLLESMDIATGDGVEEQQASAATNPNAGEGVQEQPPNEQSSSGRSALSRSLSFSLFSTLPEYVLRAPLRDSLTQAAPSPVSSHSCLKKDAL
ncbi:unnamed protein product [Calypogeia fissa]